MSANAEFTFWPHYGVDKNTIKSVAELRRFFTEGTDYELNWLFLSTSGVHGTYTKLDELHKPCADDPDCVPTRITALIVCPRLVWMRYGEFEVSLEDVGWLRSIVEKTLAGIESLQQGNRHPSPNPDEDKKGKP